MSLSDRDVVFVSVDPWQETRWARKQMFASLLAEQCRKVVYYVESERSERKVPTIQRLRHNLLLIDIPNPFRSSRMSLLTRLGNWAVTVSVKILLRCFGIREPIFIVYQPHNLWFAKKVANWTGVSLFCYDMTDDWSKFPGQSEWKVKAILEAEEKALRHADVVFAVSEVLLEKAKKYSRKAYYLPNATSFENFNLVMSDIQVDDEILRISPPRLGYVGKITGWRLDFDLIKWVAEKKPEWSIVLIGPVHPNDITQHEVSKLKPLKNIHFLGPKEYWNLARYIKGFDVCILPHKDDALTQSMDPIKLYDYMATGKPVVAANVREAAKFSSVIQVAASREEFLSDVEKVLGQEVDDLQEQRLSVAKQNSWRDRVQLMANILQSSLRKVEN